MERVLLAPCMAVFKLFLGMYACVLFRITLSIQEEPYSYCLVWL